MWDASARTEDRPLSPIGQHKGHEGKNIWSIAVNGTLAVVVSQKISASRCVLLIRFQAKATGGSDGAIRLWPLEMERSATPVFSASHKDVIVNVDISQEHVVFLTKFGCVSAPCNDRQVRLMNRTLFVFQSRLPPAYL